MDKERNGFLTPEAIHAFLAGVGLQATPFDMRHIMAELDPEHSGAVSRASFINFIRYGGQHAPPPKVCSPFLQARSPSALCWSHGFGSVGSPCSSALQASLTWTLVEVPAACIWRQNMVCSVYEL